jgi:ribosomal protein L22|tara:strand:+ start:317 stop:487 length:171 start_codon:yes stop_codon:yes gene_type:complete
MARKLGIRHSVYKLAVVSKLVSKKHLYDAQTMLSNVEKKSAEVLTQVINSARKNGV